MGRLAGSGVLMVWVDLDEGSRAESDRWYEQEHFPERITQSGYRRARRLRALSGSPAHLGVLEADTVDDLAGEGYKRVTARINEQSRRMRRAFRRIIRSPHSVIHSTGTIDGAVMLCARLQFADEARRTGFANWARTQFQGWVEARPEILGGHALSGAPAVRAYMDSFRASGQEDESADGVLLLEYGRPEDAEREALGLTASALGAMGVQVAAVDVGVYQLMIDMARRHFEPAGEAIAR